MMEDLVEESIKFIRANGEEGINKFDCFIDSVNTVKIEIIDKDEICLCLLFVRSTSRNRCPIQEQSICVAGMSDAVESTACRITYVVKNVQLQLLDR